MLPNANLKINRRLVPSISLLLIEEYLQRTLNNWASDNEGICSYEWETKQTKACRKKSNDPQILQQIKDSVDVSIWMMSEGSLHGLNGEMSLLRHSFPSKFGRRGQKKQDASLV